MARGRPKGGKNKYYSKEFKLEVLKRCFAGESEKTVAKEYGISHGMISVWNRKYREKGPAGLENKKKPGNPLAGIHRKKNLSEVERLRYELAKAQVELAKLKKLYQMERGVAQPKS